MSNSDKTDKTGDKLVASIRKTRAGAAAKKQPAKPAPRKAAPAGSADTRKRPAAKPAARATAPAGKTMSHPPAGTDAYQFGRRIWPD